MKRYEIKKEARDYGCKCDWYKKEHLGAVAAVDPRRMVDGKSWPAAYFVEAVETIRDETFGLETFRTPVAGPFSCKTIAYEWVAMH